MFCLSSCKDSNLIAGYKSDSEGLASVPKSPHTNRNCLSSDRHHYEVVILDNDLQAKREMTRIRVLPHVPSSVKSTSRVQKLRSQSLGSDAILTDKDDSSENCDPKCSNSISGFKAAVYNREAANSTSSRIGNYEDIRSPLSLNRRPIPAPRRSYLTAVESTKVASPGQHLYDEPPDAPNSNEDPNYDDVEDVYANPTHKSMRKTENKSATEKAEPIYAQVDKSKKSKREKSTPAEDLKPQKGYSQMTRQKIDRVVENTDTVFV